MTKPRGLWTPQRQCYHLCTFRELYLYKHPHCFCCKCLDRSYLCYLALSLSQTLCSPPLRAVTQLSYSRQDQGGWTPPEAPGSSAHVPPQRMLLNCWHCREQAEIKPSLLAAQPGCASEELLCASGTPAPNRATQMSQRATRASGWAGLGWYRRPAFTASAGVLVQANSASDFFVVLNSHPNHPLANPAAEEPETKARCCFHNLGSHTCPRSRAQSHQWREAAPAADWFLKSPVNTDHCICSHKVSYLLKEIRFFLHLFNNFRSLFVYLFLNLLPIFHFDLVFTGLSLLMGMTLALFMKF